MKLKQTSRLMKLPQSDTLLSIARRRLVPLLLLLAAACSKTPDGVINEDDMADIMADMLVADAYVEQHSHDFPNDSVRLALKTSVVERNGYTMADYDTSLVWYAHNMQVYQDVLSRTVERLEKREAEMAGIDRSRSHNEPRGPRRYAAVGDTADLWQLPARELMLAPALGVATYVAFEAGSDRDKAPGDRYEIDFKLVALQTQVNVMLAIDYDDGTTSFMMRNTNYDGWTRLTVQGDSALTPRRVYGYIATTGTATGAVAYLDSLCLLRTHLDRAGYSYIRTHRRVARGNTPPTAPSHPHPVPRVRPRK
ncbi:MAG: DUF4296 domain-containing protein [Muribaculaceae bacterium]|nr:DUF4296 domain-containing protein [Muribaculaceae bacterium]